MFLLELSDFAWSSVFLNLGSFLSRFERQQVSPPSVVVIGGGISGIAAAQALSNASFKVNLSLLWWDIRLFIFHL